MILVKLGIILCLLSIIQIGLVSCNILKIISGIFFTILGMAIVTEEVN
jgi:hypothetical protein